MTLDQLRVFIAVADRNHLTQAAEFLHLTPSAVSASLRALETRYDVQLFDRVGRGISLTDAGRTFLAEARTLDRLAREGEHMLSELGGTTRGRVRIQASQTIAGYWLPRPMVRFHRRYPGLELPLEVGNTRTVAEAVREGAADVGLVEGAVDAVDLAVTPFAQDRLAVVVAPHHPWAFGRPLTPAMLQQSVWISREPGSGTRAVFEDDLRRRGGDPAALQTALTFPSNEAILSALESADCAAALSELAAAPALHTGRLVRAAYNMPPRTFSLLVHASRHQTRATRAFTSYLLDEEGDAL